MKYPKNNKGYTIPELLIAVAIFSIVILGAVDIFIKSIESQRELFVESEVGNNARYAMEVMAKEIRMAENTSTVNGSYNTLTITNSKGIDIVYSLDGTRIKRKIGGINNTWITSDKIKVTNLNFFVNNWDLSAGPQPRITISMIVKSGDSEINLQTTLSLRIY